MPGRLVGGGLLALAVLPAPLGAETRTTLSLGGTYVFGVSTFSESRTFTEFVETGRIDASYRASSAPGFEGGVRYMFSRRFGLGATLGYLERGESNSYSAALPHPLYFGRPRLVSGNTGGLSYRETASHMDVVFAPVSTAHLEVLLLAGASLFKVRSDLIDHIQYTQVYPYDSVTGVSAPSTPVQSSAVGFNLGAGLQRKLSEHFGLGAQGRFCRANLRLHPSAGNTLELHAGGFQLEIGIRFLF